MSNGRIINAFTGIISHPVIQKRGADDCDKRLSALRLFWVVVRSWHESRWWRQPC